MPFCFSADNLCMLQGVSMGFTVLFTVQCPVSIVRRLLHGNFCGGFIFANFASRSQIFPLQYMAIYSNEIITKIAKLSHCEFPHLVQNRKNICTRNIWRIQYPCCLLFLFTVSNEIPEVPVVSPASGRVFEKRLIEKYISENGNDPVNGEPLSEDQLIEVKGQNKKTKFRFDVVNGRFDSIL